MDRTKAVGSINQTKNRFCGFLSKSKKSFSFISCLLWYNNFVVQIINAVFSIDNGFFINFADDAFT